jgi:hypothetical protein
MRGVRMRGMFRVDRFAAVTAILALTVALGGGSFAVARTVAASSGTSATSPILVFSVSGAGHLYAEAHRAPVSGKPRVKRVQAGAYWVTIPGIAYNVSRDPAICSAAAGAPATITVDVAGSGKTAVLAIVVEKPTGFGINASFKCAVYHLP